jgi:hypothetical protein
MKVTIIACRFPVARFGGQNGQEDTLNPCNRLSHSRFPAVHLPSSATVHRGIFYGGHVSRYQSHDRVVRSRSSELVSGYGT